MTQSIWRVTAQVQPAAYPRLVDDVEVDVAIVGGGITGITCAALLAAEGRRVALLEARTIAFGSTGNSTGNLYEVLSSGLAPVAQKWGKDVVSNVAASRRQALDLIERFAGRFGETSCFRRCPLYQYTSDDWSKMEEEYDALKNAGIAARLEDRATLPGPAHQGRAMVIDHQAQFHPLNYLRSLGAHAAELGVRVHEHSEVVEIDAEHRVLHTESGSVKAKEIVLATHTPKGIFGVHAQMLTRREYGVAGEVQSLEVPGGIFWQDGQTKRSFRNLETAGKRYVIAVGAPDKTGLHDSEKALASLRSISQEYIPPGGERWEWSAQAYESPDLLPYIGRSPMNEVYIATGFGADGLTYGTLAAQIISDDILGKENPWATLYRAARFSPAKSIKQILEEQAIALKGLVADRVGLPEYAGSASLEPGSGAVMKLNGKKVAVYRDETGSVEAVSAVCTHMGCIVHWNQVEKSWDCPCHGSRFATSGDIIEGPALSPLAAVDIEASHPQTGKK